MSASTRLRGPLLLAFLYLLPLVLAAEPLRARAETNRTLGAIAVGAGILGLTGFALNLLLGARLPHVDDIVGGLGRLYELHRVNGQIVYLLLAIHLVSMVADRAQPSLQDGLRLLSPAAGAVVFVGTVAFAAMTVAIAATLYMRLTHETFVYVQRAFGIIFLFGAAHAFMTTGIKASSRPLTLYLAALGALALAGFVYRSLLGDVLVRRYDYIVSSARRLDDHVVEIQMDPIDRRLVARPGQFVFVTFYSDRFNARFHPVAFRSQGQDAVLEFRPGEMRGQFHPFSLTSCPSDPHLSLVVKAVGTFTRALHELEPGAAARVEGPYGEFSYLNVANPRQVWLAGGIGITPFLAMARSLEYNAGYEIHLMWGVNERAQAYFASELEEIASRVTGFDFTLVPEDTDGFIDAESVASKHPLDTVDVLLVGPPAMETALRAQLLAAGHDRRRIHTERFAFGPRGRKTGR